jgi:hypothetical protein
MCAWNLLDQGCWFAINDDSFLIALRRREIQVVHKYVDSETVSTMTETSGTYVIWGPPTTAFFV